MKILVAYASRHGATKGIAERIARTLERPGLEVTLAAADHVGDPKAYDAFVVGSAAYTGGWLKEATRFVRRNQDLLASRPIWLFSSGPIGTDLVDAKGRDVIKASVPREFAEFRPELHPRDERVFFGAYDPSAPATGLMERAMGAFLRVMPSVRKQIPAGDFRDWPAIEAWAGGIAASLQPVGGAPALASS
jgi:menaquinone-dependent protoporphyrinogen oxidase